MLFQEIAWISPLKTMALLLQCFSFSLGSQNSTRQNTSLSKDNSQASSETFPTVITALFLASTISAHFH